MSRSKGELRLIAPLGGPERKLADIHARRLEIHPRFLAWCPDSKCVVVTDSAAEGQPDALFVVSLETGEKRRLTNPQSPSLADTSPAISPDGRTLAFRRVASWSSGDLYFLSLGEGVTAEETPMRRVTGGLNPDYPAWMPDSEEILFSAKGGLWRVDADGDRPERLPFVGEDGAMPTISSPNDRRPTRMVYARTFEDENVWRLDLSTPGSAPAPAIASSRSDTQPKFSSDGRRVAITSTRTGDWEIWTTDPDGGNAVQLTSMGARATGGPNWSPDDGQIVFASDLEGQFDLYIVSSAGGKPRRLTSAPSFEHGPSFSRDGRWIYFCSNRSGDYQIWRMPASGGEAIQLTRNGGWAAVPSPDGASLYYTNTTLSGATLWRVSVNGGEPERVLDGVRFWAFAPVGRGIYYAEDVGSKTRLQFFDLATAHSTTIAHDFGDVRYVPSVSADDRTILYSRLDASINDLMLVENFR